MGLTIGPLLVRYNSHFTEGHQTSYLDNLFKPALDDKSTILAWSTQHASTSLDFGGYSHWEAFRFNQHRVEKQQLEECVCDMKL